ncbi:MAG: hypothetical protein NT062_19780 [Proteobacteria bacterium]|nr:hypothetical protein [Pseudomonadota bacterium]
MTETARRVLAALRCGVNVKDEAFDRLYPEEVRRVSSVHWTPVSVALRAARWLAPEAGRRILDVGCGPGKVCLIGAISCGGTWQGVERDPALVTVARATAALLEVAPSTAFHVGDMDVVDWSGFDSFYFYNPFAAILFGPSSYEPAARWPMLNDQIARTEAQLAALPIGTRVVTYNGFGGEMPDGYVATEAEPVGEGRLVLWVKQSTRRIDQTGTVG